MSRRIETQNMFFSDQSPQEVYENWGNRQTIAYGQMKLLLTDIMFLTMFWDPKTVPYPKIVIAGAAPGHHYPTLAKMFPTATFHLYDPRRFEINPDSMERINIHQEYFTDETAKLWSGRGNVYFISDVRTVSNKKNKPKGEIDYEEEYNVSSDMKMQKNWVEIINPVSSSLKFRLPYVDVNNDGVYEDDKLVSYFEGLRMKQPWAPQTSTEVRLIPIRVNGVYKTDKKWSSILHQDQCAFYNRRIRTCNDFYNPFTNDITPLIENELTNDFDSMLTVAILTRYLVKMTGKPALQDDTVALYKVILDEVNKQRSKFLSISMLRDSKWKSAKRIPEHPDYEAPVDKRKGTSAPKN